MTELIREPLPCLAEDTVQACDEHAHCVCGGLMSYGAATGTLVCADCDTDALAQPEVPR
jgi:hypothetical protein